MILRPVLEPVHVPVEKMVVRPVLTLLHGRVTQHESHEVDVVHGWSELDGGQLGLSQTADARVAFQENREPALSPGFGFAGDVHPTVRGQEYPYVQRTPAAPRAVKVDHRDGIVVIRG